MTAAGSNRYNSLGEWKPLFYAGNTDAIESKSASMSREPYVQAALLYVLATGHLALEFVVRTTLRLPVERFDISDDLHMWLCPSPTGTTYGGRNVNLYDGWHDLSNINPVEIKTALENIRRTMNRLAFTFEATVDWRPKYSTVSHMGGSVTPVADDMPALSAILSKSNESTEDAILDAAIDWYNRGSTSQNPFVSFLCYYIALESVVIAITDGIADFGLGYSGGTKEQLREEKIHCINDLHASLFDSDPIKFVMSSYFDCVVSLRNRVREVCGLVFGRGHPYISMLLDGGESLSSIRGKVAHGQIALVDAVDQDLVSRRLPEIADISHQFLTGVILRSRPDSISTNPSWSGSHSLGISMSDPRSLLITSDWSTIQRYDWSIRPEWCD